MRIGILKCGPMNKALVGRWGEYPQIYGAFLRGADPDLDILGVDVDGGEALPDVHAADGWLVSGSRYGVYEDLDWIGPLKQFLRDAVGAGVPVVGICFGHQVLAEAMGGKVVKFPGGWGYGPSEYQAVNAPEWASSLGSTWRGHAVHQDQVVERPAGATLLATSPFCENAAFAYGDPEDPDAISVQPHPEFDDDFVAALTDARMRDLVEPAMADDAMARLGTPLNNADWARIIVAYFKGKTAGA